MEYLVCAFVIGGGATALIDFWAILRKNLFRVPLPDYGMVGRWIGHMTRGRFHHDSIAAATPIPAERWIGWIAHYLTGIAFACGLLASQGMEWIRNPTPGPALVVGFGTVTLPFLLMQPGMGAGVAASRTRRPAAARLQSLITHGLFGLGLYLAGIAVSFP